VGKPVYLNSHAYDWDQTSRDSQRWVGQLPDGSWVVGLFNRADTGAPITQTLDFASILGLTQPAAVRDLWAHQDMGSMTSWSATLAPHTSSLVKVTPSEPANYQAQVGAMAGTARFENSAQGYTGSGYVTGLDTPGSSVGMAVAVETSGTHVVTCRVANGTGEPARLALTVLDAHTGALRGSGHVALAASLSWSDWQEIPVSLSLEAGTNLVVLSAEGGRAGLNVDSLTIT
jgi:alpha-glucosidase